MKKVAFVLFMVGLGAGSLVGMRLNMPRAPHDDTTGLVKRTINVSEYIPSDVTVEEVRYVPFASSKYFDVLVSGVHRQRDDEPFREGYCAAITFDSQRKQWVRILEHEQPMGDGVEFVPFELTSPPVHCLIYKCVGGSGAYLDYKVLAVMEGEVTVLLEGDTLFQGSLELCNNRILEYMGHQARSYTWNGRCFEGVTLDQEPDFPRSMDTAVVRYSIEPPTEDDPNVRVVFGGRGIDEYEAEPTASMEVGQKLRLLRTNAGMAERVLWGNDGVIESDNGRDWTAKGEGQAEITIVPNGYDWQYARSFKVEVKGRANSGRAYEGNI